MQSKENLKEQIPYTEDNEPQIKEQEQSTAPGDIEWLNGFEDKVIIKKEVIIMENPDVQTLAKCWSCSEMYYASNHHCPFCGACYSIIRKGGV